MVPVPSISRSHRIKIDFQDENLKESSRLKPQGLEPGYLVCSITEKTSTKIVQILPFGPKMGLPWGSQVYIGLYREIMKKNLV